MTTEAISLWFETGRPGFVRIFLITRIPKICGAKPLKIWWGIGRFGLPDERQPRLIAVTWPPNSGWCLPPRATIVLYEKQIKTPTYFPRLFVWEYGAGSLLIHIVHDNSQLIHDIALQLIHETSPIYPLHILTLDWTFSCISDELRLLIDRVCPSIQALIYMPTEIGIQDVGAE